jgi:long-chain acyl-CoA synthetase
MLSRPQSVVDVFVDSCARFAENPAFSGLGHTLTFRDIERLTADFAAYIQNHTPLQPGDRIAVQLPNIVQYPVVVFGALRAGLIVVNTNPLYTPREIEHQLLDSGARALVVLANIADKAATIVHKTCVSTVIVTELADLHTAPRRVLINSAAKYLKKMVPAFSYPNQIRFVDVMAKGRAATHKDVAADPEETAVLQYTGGTTGVAKGVMLSHSNLVANMVQAEGHLGDPPDTTGAVYVAPLPLYHIFAFTVHCMCLLNRGDHSLLIANPRDIPAFIKALKKFKMAGFVGINTLFSALCRNESFRTLDFSELQLTASGGMALTENVSKQWKDVTGCEINEGFGLTETSPMVAFNPLGAVQQGTVGLPLADTQIKIIDASGAALPAGEAGELCVKGPQVMTGYWNRPEETREVLDEDNWLKTGDIAVLQADGYLRIVDRKKDMVIVSGFNVYPNEIEDVIFNHPDIVEAAAIGVEDEDSGEAVKLFAVSSNSELTEADVRLYCREYLTAYKVPKFVEFMDELPKTNVGKILRRELRDLAKTG